MHNSNNRFFQTRLALSLILVFMLVGVGCQHNVNTNPVTPKTSLQWTIVYNAAVAKTNLAVEQSVETVQKQGLITAAQARPIIVICGKIAQESEAIRGITSSGTEATWNVDAVKIKALVTAIGPNPFAGVGVSNQTLDLAISAAAAAITLLVSQLGS